MPTLLVHCLPSWGHIVTVNAFINDVLAAHSAIDIVYMYHALLDQPLRNELEVSFPAMPRRRLTLIPVGGSVSPSAADAQLVAVTQMTEVLEMYISSWPASLPKPVGIVLDSFTPRKWYARFRAANPDIKMYLFTATAATLLHSYMTDLPSGKSDYAKYVDKYATPGMSDQDRTELAHKILLATNGHTELNGTVVPVPGLPDMYDYERELGCMPTGFSMAIIKDLVDTTNDFDGILFPSSTCLEPEAIQGIVASERPMPSLPIGGAVCPRAWTGSLLGEGVIREFHQLQRRNSVLYISFGTLFFPERYMDVVLETLLDMQQPFLFACGAANRGRIPDALVHRIDASPRALITFEWVDQIGILSHPAVGWICSHCGLNSIHEAIAAGKPIIAWPQVRFQDQAVIAAMISTRAKPLGFELIQVRVGHAQRPAKRGVDVLGTDEAVVAEVREVIRQAFKCEAGRARKRHVLEMRDQLRAEQEGAARIRLRDWVENDLQCQALALASRPWMVNTVFEEMCSSFAHLPGEDWTGEGLHPWVGEVKWKAWAGEDKWSDTAAWAAKVSAEAHSEEEMSLGTTRGFPSHLLNEA